MKVYAAKEAYYTLQGEGAQTGRAAVFFRFSGCNLWTGREKDRHKATCQFCDTDFVGINGEGGGKFKAAAAVADHIEEIWSTHATGGTPYVICTGGEPLLQLDPPLIEELHQRGFEVGVETNGTIAAPAGLDWICVSPKANATMLQTSGNEIKLVYPQPLAMPDRFEEMEFENFFLQPMDGPDSAQNVEATADYCMKNPKWRLSLQTHKLIGLP
ncbi:MAG: 7-carboxy-7-deazaguanine synthase [Pseudomonadota bacterium]